MMMIKDSRLLRGLYWIFEPLWTTEMLSKLWMPIGSLIRSYHLEAPTPTCSSRSFIRHNVDSLAAESQTQAQPKHYYSLRMNLSTTYSEVDWHLVQ